MIFKILLRLWGVLFLIFILTGCVAAPLVNLTPTFAPAQTETAVVSLTSLPPTSAKIPTPSATLSPPLTPTIIISPELSPTATPFPTPTPSTTGTPTDIKHVVIISIDGLRPDAIEQAEMPTFRALRAKGAYSPAAQTILPSVTLIAHASMLGGMKPKKHGITWNELDPARGKIHGPTLFSVAHAAGLSTAMVVGKPKLEHLVLPDSVDNFDYAGFTDRQMVNHALAVIQAGLPNVLFIHLPDVDSAGHAAGWMSVGQLKVASMTDGLLGEIVAALETGGYLKNTLLIITADHGGQGVSHGGNSPEETTIPWLAVGPGVPAGVTLNSPIVIYDTAATALYALKIPIPTEWDGRPVLELFQTSPLSAAPK
jgi:predicted AlkP superfamily pyrophosphatase or phosphodiesterase